MRELEERVCGLRRGQPARLRQQFARDHVIARLIDRLDGSELIATEAKHRKLARGRLATHHGTVQRLGHTGDLQSVGALVAPEPGCLGVWRCAPCNAHHEIVSRADFVSRSQGGQGAVREVCDLLLCATGHYQTIAAKYTL